MKASQLRFQIIFSANLHIVVGSNQRQLFIIMWLNYVSELQPLADILFIPQMI
jgi:hypothetical protein